MARSHKYTPFERLLALITKVRPGEGRAVALFGAHIFLILFSYYLFKAAREGLLLARLSAADASYATATLATLLIFIVPLYSQIRRRLDGPLLVIAVIVFCGPPDNVLDPRPARTQGRLRVFRVRRHLRSD